jgi:hypothetical protein
VVGSAVRHAKGLNLENTDQEEEEEDIIKR